MVNSCCAQKVTGSTICGSDLHLYHGEIMGLQKGDILGHEVRIFEFPIFFVLTRAILSSSWVLWTESGPTSRTSRSASVLCPHSKLAVANVGSAKRTSPRSVTTRTTRRKSGITPTMPCIADE